LEEVAVAAYFVAFLNEIALEFVGVFVELRESVDFVLVELGLFVIKERN
jgi:hypothetical protein